MEPNNKENILDNISKLKWACRRGMLELDVLLNNFLDHHYAELTTEDKKRFVNLLNCTDPELFAWLLGSTIPDDKELANIVAVIRHHARSRI